jgi:gamma-glutamyltranspeptidase/glutathione hydrolase
MLRFLILLVGLWLPAWAVANTPRPPGSAVATAHPEATRAAIDILRRGGNAFDAAVAASAVLAVVEPYGHGLGGGGFYLLRVQPKDCPKDAKAKCEPRDIMIDARERAPLAITVRHYLDAQGRPKPRATLDGPLAAGIPGTPAALAHLAERYGRLPLSVTLAPAIRLARDGSAVQAPYRLMAEWRAEALRRDPESRRIFLNDGFVPDDGHVMKQPQLAETLERLAKHGHDGFYGGETARRLVDGVRASGGVWTKEDLSGYRVVERAPVQGRYRDLHVTSAALPSSGGIVLIEALGILEYVKPWELNRADRVHAVIEAMRIAYRDRARFLGDPDMVPVDTKRLLSSIYHARQRALIRPHARARLVGQDRETGGEGTNTTHLSVIDRDGNRVAATLSLNTPFGAAFTVPGTGVLLNNQMDDFVLLPGAANTYGLVGSRANKIAPGKRPLSSMSPTFLENEDKLVILGTPGGSRIISMVLLTTLDVADGRGDAAGWVKQPRFHHQYLPDRVEYEPEAIDRATLEHLRKLGHPLREIRPYGNMQLIVWDKRRNRLQAVSDPRSGGEGRVETGEAVAPDP